MISVGASSGLASLRAPRVFSTALAAALRGGCTGSRPLSASSEGGLVPDRFIPLAVRRVDSLSHDTKMIDVALPREDATSGLVTSSFVMVQGRDGSVARPYTPVSPCSERGSIRLVVKKYPDGVVSSHLHSLRPGDSVYVKGPILKLRYTPNMRRRIGMVAGGTGITPMLQVVREVLSNSADKTEVSLLFANNKEEDILLKAELDALAAAHSNFAVTYILSQPPPSWTGHRGHVSAELVARTMPAPVQGEDAPLIYVCGPPGMMEAVSGPKAPDKSQGQLGGLLKERGYSSDMVFKV